MSDKQRTDEILVYYDYKEYDDDLADALVKHACKLERENAELADQVMRWFKAASPYATPGSLEEGLKKLREELIEECALICESRAGEGQYAESQAAWRILISAAHAIRALKNFQPDGPIDSTVKPSACGTDD